MTAIDAPVACPECGESAIARLALEPPWCVACEWNLGEWPEPKQKRGRRRVLRERRRAYALNRRLLAEFDGALPGKPRSTRAAKRLAAASVALLAIDVLMLAGGVYLMVSGYWLLKFAGFVLILIAIECRLRFGKVDRAGELSRDQAPALWAVLDAARDAVGAPEIDTLTLTNDFNASCGRYGLRRRIVLELGVPLWGALSPSGRAALLGHELGHLVNADPTTGFWTQPALSTLGRLAEIFDPHSLVDSDNSVSDAIGTLVAYTVFYPLHHLFRSAQRALWRSAGEEHQRAEVYADGVGARLGGTAGNLELAHALLSPDLVNTGLIGGATVSADPDLWRAEVAAALDVSAQQRRFAEQRSLRRHASPFSSHPPNGLRSRLAASWSAAAVPTTATLPQDALAAADRDLARAYRSAQRAILNRSVF